MEDGGNWRRLLESLDPSDEEQLKSSLKTLLQQSLELQNREDANKADIDRLGHTLTKLVPEDCSTTLASDEGTLPASVESSKVAKLVFDEGSCHSEIVLDLIKLLRNLCAGVRENQRMIIRDADILPRVVSLCSLHPQATPTGPLSAFVKVILQLLGNACAGFPEGQEGVWQLCFPQLFRHLLSAGSDDVIEMCCMVIHNCTASNHLLRSQLCSRNDDVSSLIGQLLRCLPTMQQTEWIMILLDSLIECTAIEELCNCLASQERREKLTLLRILLSRVNTESKYSNKSNDVMELAAKTSGTGDQSELSKDDGLVKEIINERNIPFFESNYVHYSSQLLKCEAAALKEAYALETTDLENSSTLMVQTAIALLRLLCRCAEVERLLTTLQQSYQVLDYTIALLRQLASLDGSETSAQHRSRLSKVKPTGKEPQQPTFGLKRDLVQLVGNLSYKCPAIQDRVREVNSIHLILNQCSIDHYNPYITQCAIWTIRNLCEANPTNQSFIGELEQRGVANAHALLEFGVEVEIGDDGKIKLKRSAKPPSQPHP